MSQKKINLVILAAGNASRINKENQKENLILKPFLEIGSQPIIFHILFSFLSGFELIFKEKNELKDSARISIIINKNFNAFHLKSIEAFIEKINFQDIKIEFIVQDFQNGTGGAVSEFLEKSSFRDEFKENDRVLVCMGDHPLIQKETIFDFISEFEKNNADMLFGAFENHQTENQYGRIELNESENIKLIHEYREYRQNQEIKENIKLCNGPISLFSFGVLNESLSILKKEWNLSDQKNEIYLHSVINKSKELFSKKEDGKNAICKVFVFKNSLEAIGLNTFEELSKAEKIFQEFQRKKFSKRKINFQDIESVVFAPFVEIEDLVEIHAFVKFASFVQIKSNSKIESFSILGPNLEIGQSCLIKSHCVLSDSKISHNCQIGPFANINSNNLIGANNIIGNFMEVKRSEIGQDNKMKHHSYISDSKIGQENNIGAGVIFCNYDGIKKNETKIGDSNLIGANSCLVAPLKIGDLNLIGAGSVITSKIDDHELVIARSRQLNMKRPQS